MQITANAVSTILSKIKSVDTKVENIDVTSDTGVPYAITSGSELAYTVSLPNITEYKDGLIIIINPHKDCGYNPTLNINNLGSSSILINGKAAKSGDIKAGIPIQLVRIGNSFFILKSNATGLNVFASNSLPSTLDGVWIKTNSKVEQIVNGVPSRDKYIRIHDCPISYTNGGICNIGDGFILFKNDSDNCITSAYLYNTSSDNYKALTNFPPMATYKRIIYYNGTTYIFCTNDTSTYVYDYKYYNDTYNLKAAFDDIIIDTSSVLCVYNDYIYIFNATSGGKSYRYDVKNASMTKITSAPGGCMYNGAIACNGVIYIVSKSDGSSVNNIYEYDIANNSYTLVKETPICFTGTSIVDGNNNIYLLGSDSLPSCVYKYDIEGNNFCRLKNVPYNFYDGLAVYSGRNIYIFSGPDDSKYAYKLELNSYTLESQLGVPYDMSKGSAAYIDGYMYIMGGSTSANASKNFYKYDYDNYKYIKLDDLPMHVFRSAVTTIRDCIYMFGSFNSDDGDVAYKYNTSTNKFTKLATIPQQISFASASAVGSDIYIFGCPDLNSDDNENHVVYKYDTILDSYSKVSNMPFSGTGCATCTYGKYIYIFGSNNGTKNYAYRYNTDKDTYTNIGQIPYNFYFGGVARIHDSIYIVGGKESTNKVCVYDIKDNVFTDISDIDINTYNGAVISDGINIHILGGASNRDYTILQFLYPYKNTLFINDNGQHTNNIKLYNVFNDTMDYRYITDCHYVNNNSMEISSEIYLGNSHNWRLLNDTYGDIVSPSDDSNLTPNVNIVSTRVYALQTTINNTANLYSCNISSIKDSTSRINFSPNLVEIDENNGIEIIASSIEINQDSVITLNIRAFNNNLSMIITPDNNSNTFTGYNEFTYIVRKNGTYKFLLITKDNIVIEKVIKVNNISYSNLRDFYVNNFIRTSDDSSLTDNDKSVIDERKKIISEKLPLKLINYLYTDNYVITFVPSSIKLSTFLKNKVNSSTSIADGIGGITYYARNEIYLTCDSVKPQTTIHEIGHAIDKYYGRYLGGMISERDDYKAIYNSKSDYSTIFSSDTYFLQNITEYFAQNFAYFFTPMSLNPMEMDGPKNKAYFNALNTNEWS